MGGTLAASYGESHQMQSSQLERDKHDLVLTLYLVLTLLLNN